MLYCKAGGKSSLRSSPYWTYNKVYKNGHKYQEKGDIYSIKKISSSMFFISCLKGKGSLGERLQNTVSLVFGWCRPFPFTFHIVKEKVIIEKGLSGITVRSKLW